MTTPPADWLTADMVAAWLKLGTPSAADQDLLAQCAAVAQLAAQSARPDQWAVLPSGDGPPGRVYRPDAEVLTTATMYAAKVFRRRNSPGGMETSFDQVTYVASFDPEIQRGFRQGRYRRPATDTAAPREYGGVW